MTERKIIGETTSVCPVCLQQVAAQRVQEGAQVYLEKSCPEHGDFRVLVWDGEPAYQEWGGPKEPVSPVNPLTAVDKGCPYDCGLCPDHRQRTCCVLLEVTERCDLGCPLCFAAADSAPGNDPTLAEIDAWYEMLLACGGPFNIQLSGGEPSLRDDLPQIIAMGRQKGFTFFQLNTNGLRLAAEPFLARVLKVAGLNCVFLQFDGLDDDIYRTLRGRALLAQKLAALDNCAAAGLAVVLVPTIVPGVNDGAIGDILRLAVQRMPYVRGVHFQPVSYFGRYEQTEQRRITIPELLRQIERQTAGQIKAADFKGGTAENCYCSFNGNFLLQADGSLQALKKQPASCCCCAPEQESAAARSFVAKQWGGAPEAGQAAERCCEPQTLDQLVERTQQYKLAVSGMAFMDAWNLDLDRLRECYINVVSRDGRLVPFCAYNLTAANGRALYRGEK